MSLRGRLTDAGRALTSRASHTLNLRHTFLLRIVLLMFVVFGLGAMRSTFNVTLSIWGLLQGATMVCLLGVAIATTMIGGELDLSIAAVAGLSAILSAKLLDHSLMASIAVPLVAGVIVGVVQGAAIVFFRVISIVFTLGTMIALGGLEFVITSNGKTVVASESSLVLTVTKRHWIFTALSLGMLAVVVIYQIFLSYSRIGTRLYAFGGSRKEAVLAGVNPRRMTIFLFAMSGLFASAAGIASALSSASAVPGGPDSLLLPAVAVALVGGISLRGGNGGPIDVLIGALLVVGVDNELSARGISSESQSLATAILLLLAVVIGMWSDRRAAQLGPASASTLRSALRKLVIS